MQSISLNDLADQQLAIAAEASSGRSAHTLHGGPDHALRQTVIALAAGNSLSDHESPGEATLHVLRGSVRLTTATDAWEGASGDHIVIPSERHGLAALTDAVVLLTVYTHVTPKTS